MQLTVSILGPLQAHTHDGTPIPIGGARLRALLIRLAHDPGRSDSVATLTDALWNETPPDGAANALQSHITRQRRTLGTP
uniref:AfsR/SARP family transcriptional regulator n=1 Tax=Catenulispora pinisilvae TaxID=2705253 RepID=UPI001891637B